MCVGGVVQLCKLALCWRESPTHTNCGALATTINTNCVLCICALCVYSPAFLMRAHFPAHPLWHNSRKNHSHIIRGMWRVYSNIIACTLYKMLRATNKLTSTAYSTERKNNARGSR